MPVPHAPGSGARPDDRRHHTNGGSDMDPDRYRRTNPVSDPDRCRDRDCSATLYPHFHADGHAFYYGIPVPFCTSVHTHVDPDAHVDPDTNREGDPVLQLQRQRVDRGPVPRDVHDSHPDTCTRRQPAGSGRRGLGELEPDTGPKSCSHRDALWWNVHTLPFSDRSYVICSDCHASVLPDPVR